jgi:cell wall-associated NlpC family hydrolase
MKLRWSALLLLITLFTSWSLAASNGAAKPETFADFWNRFKTAIESHLGKPYVWGACGLKSFDCSGFIYRVMTESGIFIKRTTARRYYLTLPEAAGDKWKFGTLVFFDDLKHVGIVAGPDSFYHAALSLGTSQAGFDPYWRKKIYGFRKIPLPRN